MPRIMSWNVNGIRACAGKGLYEWIARESPDFICLQETKAHLDQLPAELAVPRDADGRPYHVYWAQAARRGYSGAAIFSKVEAKSTSFLGVDEFDVEGRTMAADFGDFTLVSAYFPNSQDAGARIGYKVRYCDAMLAFCDRLVAQGKHVVVSGDYNIAHTEIDLARPKDNEGSPGYLPEERAWMGKYLSSGYVDSFRTLHPEPGNYTWWTYRVKSARENNVGWRIDYHCVDEGLRGAIRAAAIHPEVTGSDHCPVSLDLEF